MGVSTLRDGQSGMPMMGSAVCDILVLVDMNDRLNVPFATLSKLFDLALLVNRSKIRDIVLTFWADDSAQDVICTYRFRGWVSNYVTSTGVSRGGEGGTNHLLTLTLQPELDPQQYVKIQMGN